MIELRLRRAWKFTSEYPQLTSITAYDRCLMKSSRWWSIRCFNKSPLVFLNAVNIQIIKHSNLVSIKIFTTKQNQLIFFRQQIESSSASGFTIQFWKFFLQLLSNNKINNLLEGNLNRLKENFFLNYFK